ncbi:MAG: pyridoxamine 5'-phosphate oxidase [Alphaproteobacteria bacterium]|nr:pyridoxamine 5'-phosphate oxidase [Alphaproteobacteria bacterium]
MKPSSDIAFTPRIKSIQTERGSRAAYARQEQKGGWPTAVTPHLAATLAETNSFYLATVSSEGQPYIQHRGGPKGFLRIIDETTLGFADFAGNRQYITTGNLADNPRAFLFLMDYVNRRRVKIWGTAKVVADPDLLARLFPEVYEARPEQAILFSIAAWDRNCPQHIPQMFPAEEVTAAVDSLVARIKTLEAELAQARGPSPPPAPVAEAAPARA